MNYIKVNESLTNEAIYLLGMESFGRQVSDVIHIVETAKVDLATVPSESRSSAIIGMLVVKTSVPEIAAMPAVRDKAGKITTPAVAAVPAYEYNKLISISVYASKSDIPALLSLTDNVHLYRINAGGQLVPAKPVDVIMSVSRADEESHKAQLAEKDTIILEKDTIIANLNRELAEARSKKSSTSTGTGTGTGKPRATALSTKLETMFSLTRDQAIAFSKLAISEGYIKIIGKPRDANVQVEKLKDYVPATPAPAPDPDPALTNEASTAA